MGPEEIHIYFWEGAPRPPKSKCDRPKNLEVFLVNFQIRYLSHVVLAVFPMWWGVGWMDQLKLKLTQPKLSLSWGFDKVWQQINVTITSSMSEPTISTSAPPPPPQLMLLQAKVMPLRDPTCKLRLARFSAGLKFPSWVRVWQ